MWLGAPLAGWLTGAMRVLVTGAFGFIGTAVARRFTAAGHDVVALTSRQPGSAPDATACETIHADIRDGDAMRRAVTGTDAVCHLAALTRVRESAERRNEYWAVNHGGTCTLVAAALAESARSGTPMRFLFASAGAVYGAPEIQPIAEDAALNPTTVYGETKAAAEREVLGPPLDGRYGAVVLRVFNVSGAADGRGDDDLSRIVPKTLAVARGDAPLLQVNGDGSAVRDFVHVDDLARAFALALDHAEPDRRAVFNVGATGASVAEIIAGAREITGRTLAVEHLPPKPEVQTVLADTTRIRTGLGWAPERSTLAEMLADAWAASGSVHSA